MGQARHRHLSLYSRCHNSNIKRLQRASAWFSVAQSVGPANPLNGAGGSKIAAFPNLFYTQTIVHHISKLFAKSIAPGGWKTPFSFDG